MDILSTLFDFPVTFDTREFFRQLTSTLPFTFMPEDPPLSALAAENEQILSQISQEEEYTPQRSSGSTSSLRNGSGLSAVPGSSTSLPFLHPSLVPRPPPREVQAPRKKTESLATTLGGATPMSGEFTSNKDSLSPGEPAEESEEEEENDEETEEEEEVEEDEISESDESESELETQQPPPKRRRLSSGAFDGRSKRGTKPRLAARKEKKPPKTPSKMRRPRVLREPDAPTIFRLPLDPKSRPGYPYWGAEHSKDPPLFVSTPIPKGDIGLHLLEDPPPGERPAYSLQTLIKAAILGCPTKKLRINDILDQIMGRFEYYRNGEQKREKGWKNSIRHHLSLSACFIKQEKDIMETGKGVWWIVDESVTGGTKRARKRRPRGKKAIAEAAAREAEDPMSDMQVIQYNPNPTPSRSSSSPTEGRAPSPTRPGWDGFGPTNDLLEMSMEADYTLSQSTPLPRTSSMVSRSLRRTTESRPSTSRESSQLQLSDNIGTIIQLPGYEGLLSPQHDPVPDSTPTQPPLGRSEHPSFNLPYQPEPISNDPRIQSPSISVAPSSSRDKPVVVPRISNERQKDSSYLPQKRGIFELEGSTASTMGTASSPSTSTSTTSVTRQQHQRRINQNGRPSAVKQLPARVYQTTSTITFRDASSRPGGGAQSATETRWQGTSGLHFAAAHNAPVSTRLKAPTDFAFPDARPQSNDAPPPPLISISGRFSPFSDVTSTGSTSD
ncbi:hypothetical protein FRC17_002518 [Serendipita sp. 399]|nr:hypothetical protein FRC17_002518 [Serendipita sp. 399]